MTVSVNRRPREAGAEAGAEVLRPHAEDAFADELAALAAQDDRPRPARWKLSPWAVATYLLGGTLPDGTVITPKYVGPRRIVEVAVTTLATDRALLLLGVPGTAKTWVSEHLAAAVSGDSTLLVQGTAGTPGGGDPLRLELRAAARQRPEPRRPRAQPGHAGHGGGHDRPGRGADPHPGRRAGHAHHDPVREDAADPGAGPGGAGRARASTSSPPPTTATAGSTTSPARCAAASTPWCCRCPRRRGGGRHRLAPRRPDRPLARPAGGARRHRRDPPRRHRLPRAARRRHGRRPYEAQVALRHAVHGRGDLRRHQRPGAGRPLRRRRAARRATSPRASSAPSSATRRPTGSSGRSTWRRSSASATAGRTSTGPAGR